MKRKIHAQFDSILLLTVCIMFIIKTLLGLNILWPCSVLSALILLRHLPTMSKSYKAPAWIFTTTGILLMSYNQVNIRTVAEGITSMLPTVAIVSIMQTLSIAIGCGHYDKYVSDFLSFCGKHEGRLYLFIEMFSHLLCSILNLGEVVIVLNSIDEKLSREITNYKLFISKAISCGHCTAFLWAPGSVTVLLTLQIFQLDWLDYVLPAMTVALLGILISCCKEYPALKHQELEQAVTVLHKEAIIKLISLLLAILAIIGNMIFLKHLFPASTSTEILVIDVAIVAFIWIILQKDKTLLKEEFQKFNYRTLPSMGGLCAFFISMGIFSSGMQCAGLEHLLNKISLYVASLPGILILVIVPLIMISFSLLGIHPMVSLTVLGPALLGLTGSVSPLQLALSTAMGCCLAYMVSPFAGLILFLSQQLNIPARTIALKYNLIQGCLYFVIGTATIYYIF